MHSISIVELIISFVLFFVMFYGIGFLVNMLLRMTWLMSFVYPFIVVLIVDDVSFLDYIFKPSKAFPALWDKLTALQTADITILTGGFLGTIVAGITIIILRKKGYRMF